jgi:hypothetical protein
MLKILSPHIAKRILTPTEKAHSYDLMTTFSVFFESLATDPVQRRQQFQAFVRWFLKADPESAERIVDIWSWSEYPGRWSVESNIDLVFRQKNGELWAVLALSVSPDYEIVASDLDAFFKESNRAEIDRRLLIATTDRIDASTQKVCDTQEKKTIRFMRADFESANVSVPDSIETLLAELANSRQATNAKGLVVDQLAQDVKGAAIQATYRFSDMGLNVGDRLQLQLPAMLGPERPVVRLIGYIRGVSILVTAPVASTGMPIELVEGEEVIVRLFSALAVYGFPASVVRLCRGPIAHLHLEFPSEVQGRVIRAERRIRTNVITSVAVTSSVDEPVPALITNLSPTGCMLDAQRKIGDRDTHVRISLQLSPHGQEHLLELDAVIRSAEDIDGSPKTRHGIKFNELPPHTSLVLHSYIYHQLVELPGSAI